MSDTYTIGGNRYALVNCCNCGVTYLIPAVINKTALEERGRNGKSIHCPNGHSWHYTGETDAERERRRAERAEQQIAQWRDIAAQAERSATAYKGQITKLKKRAKAGVCPCCTRHFDNLERHMKSKHPDMSVEAELTVIAGGKSA